MKKFSISLLYSVVAIAVTVILFFLILVDVEKETMHYLALGGVVFAELITAAYGLFTKGSPKRLAAVTISAVMIPVALILGFIYVLEFPEEYGTFFGWYSVLTLLVNVTALALMFIDSGSRGENKQQQAARNNVMVLRKLVHCVLLEPGAGAYEKRLRKIDDDLHYTNGTVYSAEDENIRMMLLQLQTGINGPAEQVEAQLANIERAVQRRTIMTSRNL